MIKDTMEAIATDKLITTEPLSDEEVVRRVLDGEIALFEIIMLRAGTHRRERQGTPASRSRPGSQRVVCSRRG